MATGSRRIARAGCASSTRSNRSSSTPAACREKRLKLVPSRYGVAPRGVLAPRAPVAAARANRRLIGTVYGSFLMVEERTMPRAYSGDLRRRVVAAALEGGQSREVVARRFAVGRSSVYRWVETAQTEGRLEARPMRGGPRPMIRDETEAALKDMVKSDNHLTLAEYRDRLADRTEIRVHPWTVGRALRRLGLTRKKEDLACDRAGRGRDLGGTPSLA